MNRTLTIITQELLTNLKRRSYLLMTFGVPLLAILLVVGVMLFRGEDAAKPTNPFSDLPAEPIGYVDHSRMFPFPGQFAEYLVTYSTEAEAQGDLIAGKLSSYYIIPADYLATGQVTRYSAQFNVIESDTGLVESFFVTSMLANDSPLLLARLQSPATIIEHQLDKSGQQVTEIEGDSFDKFGLVYGFALIMMFSTFFNANYLMRSVIVEKENRMIEIILSSLRPFQILSGKVFGQGAAGLLQLIIWLGSVFLIIQITGTNIPFVGQVDIPLSTMLIALFYYLGGYLLFGAFAAGIGAVSTNMREGPQYSVIYSLPAVAPLLLMTQIMQAPNGPLAVGLSFFPMTAPLGMMERLAITAVPAWQILLSLALLFAGVVVALWLAARLFRVNTLLAGELPTRKELVQLILPGLFNNRNAM